jgi:predicted ATP-grasp superfamily ATP-dependent carboligase
VFLCNNKEELIQNYKKAITVIPANEVIIQAVIKSESDGLYSACFLYNKDHAIQSFVGRRARQHPPDFGNATTFAQIIENDELESLAIKILNEIEYTGLCEVEFMHDKNDNKFKFLEINPRTWKWHSIANKANVNMLESYVQLLSNKPLSKKKKADFASFRHLITDIPTLIKYKQKKLFKKYPKYPMQYAVYDLKDLKPFIFELIYLPITIFKR